MEIRLNPSELSSSLLGGVLIGTSASLFYYLTGRLSGLSGLLSSGVFSGSPQDLAYLGGLSLAGAALSLPPTAAASGSVSAAAVLGGALVGAGSYLGNGCTSGHGICGLGRLSPRSLAAVLTFMATASATATLAPALPALALPYLPSPALTALPFLAAALAGSPWKAASKAGPPLSAATLAASLLCGGLFGIGLLWSGMSDPAAVLGFLNPLARGGWNPRLAAVMGSGVAVTLLTFNAFSKMPSLPLLAAAGSAEAKPLSSMSYGACAANTKVDASLLGGAALFGLGWGICGVCPGPAIVAAAGGSLYASQVLTSIILGTFAASILAPRA
jgi:uncharacterized membrane protein YedE/YeeE